MIAEVICCAGFLAIQRSLLEARERIQAARRAASLPTSLSAKGK